MPALLASNPAALNPVAITAFTATTAVGPGNDALSQALREHRSGLAPDDYAGPATGVVLPTWSGRVREVDDAPLPAPWQAIDCRNHRLAWLALWADGFLDAARAAVERHGASRVAVLLGTSTSTIEASEAAYRDFARTGVAPATLARTDLHHLHATTAFVRDAVGAAGPCSTISTACSSSAKVFAQAARLLATGLVDAAIVGGVDSLAASTLFGFRSLGLVSSSACRPFDVRRDGISIGEAGGFALLERMRTTTDPLLIGYGESSDAHHMSSPHPEGRGARLAIEAALVRSGLTVDDVDYINLHGTATPKNDAVEAALIASMFPPTTHAGSTKDLTGHTLGAAGIVEAVITLIAMRDGHAPGMAGDAARDPLCGPQIRVDATDGPIGIGLSNAFAFGGNNCVLAFARDADALRAATRWTPLEAAVAGIGVWSPRAASWPAFRHACLGTDAEAVAASQRPTPLSLPAAERRRVPDGVAVALEVAREALLGSEASIDPRSLASVFASAHGELAIVDYLCTTLASDPLLLSPTRFHHSVHNAAAGYWGIATPSVGPSTSIAAGDDSFVLGLVEAMTQVVAEERPVLLVVFDTPAVGLLRDAVSNASLFGAALLLTPLAVDRVETKLSIDFDQAAYDRDEPLSEAIAALADTSPAASAVWLLDALARRIETTIDFPLQAAPTVSVNVRFGAGS